MAKDYHVVTGGSLSELVENVNDCVTRGYKPVGGILLTSEADEATAAAIARGADVIPYRSVYHQAMFLEK